MIKSLTLNNVTYAADRQITFVPTVNMLHNTEETDNTIVLDSIWCGLTNTWPQKINNTISTNKMPTVVNMKMPSIDLLYNDELITSMFVRREQSWNRVGNRITDAIIMYFMNNSAVSLYDPSKNNVLVLSKSNTYDGYNDQKGNPRCNGMIYDLVYWQREKGERFERFLNILYTFSKHYNKKFIVSDPTRIEIHDIRDYLTLKMNDSSIPLVFLPEPVQKLIQLAYIITWTIYEHNAISLRLRNHQPVNKIIFMMDSFENNLYANWKELFVKSIQEVLCGYQTQFIISTYDVNQVTLHQQ